MSPLSPTSSTSSTSLPPGRSAYWEATRTGTYGFLSALPLLVAYEIMIAVANSGASMPVRIGSELWLKRWIAFAGGTGLWVLTGVVLLTGTAILYMERKKRVPLKAGYFAGLIAESAIYAVAVAALVSYVVAALFAMAPAPVAAAAPVAPMSPAAPLLPQAAADLWTQLALSIGAGLYEELFFRVLLVGGLFLLFRMLIRSQTMAYVAAALIGAALFSAAHYVGTLGDPFALDSFTFRFLFGLVLNVLFLVRGFGVAAWTHALYDVWLALGLFG